MSTRTIINCIIVSGPHQDGRVWVSGGQQATVGRMDRADFCFPNDPELSSVHFSLRGEDGRCVLQDLGSTNGTFVEGQRITEATLKDGEKFRAGRSVFAVEVTESGQSASSHGSSLDQATAEPTVASDPQEISRTLAKPHHPAPSPTKSFDFQLAPAEVVATSITPGIMPTVARHPPAVGVTTSGGTADDGTRYVLRIQTVGGDAEAIELGSGQSVVFGRTSVAQHVISSDAEISSLHFEFSVDDGICFVRDLSSSNGTFVNEIRVARQAVNVGDVIRAGKTTFRISLKESAAPTVPPSIHATVVLTDQDGPANQSGHERPSVKPTDSFFATVHAESIPRLETSLPTDAMPDPLGFCEYSATTEPNAIREPDAVPLTPTPPPATCDGSPFAVEPMLDPIPERIGVRLTYVVPGSPLRECWLTDGDTIVFGRADEADHVIQDDPELSAQHFKIIVDGTACVIQNFADSEVTFVNGQRIDGQILYDGDTIVAGTTTFKVILHSASPTTIHITPEPTHPEIPHRSIVDQQAFDGDIPSAVAKQTESAGQFSVIIHAPGSQPRVVWLADGQTTVGGSEQADICVEADSKIAARHFEIIAEGGACAIRDLESGLVTSVNGEIVAMQVLCDGDVIEAGESQFTIAIRS